MVFERLFSDFFAILPHFPNFTIFVSANSDRQRILGNRICGNNPAVSEFVTSKQGINTLQG